MLRRCIRLPAQQQEHALSVAASMHSAACTTSGMARPASAHRPSLVRHFARVARTPSVAVVRPPIEAWSARPPPNCTPAMRTTAGSGVAASLWPASVPSRPILLYEAPSVHSLVRSTSMGLCFLVPLATGVLLFSLWRQREADEKQRAAALQPDDSGTTMELAPTDPITPLPPSSVSARPPRSRQHGDPTVLLTCTAVAWALAIGLLAFNRRLVQSIHLHPRSRLLSIRPLHTFPAWRMFGGAPRPLLVPLDAVLPPLAASGRDDHVVVRLQIAQAPRVDAVEQFDEAAEQAAAALQRAAQLRTHSRQKRHAKDRWATATADLQQDEEAGTAPVSAASSSATALRPAQSMFLYTYPNDVLKSDRQPSAELSAAYQRLLCTGLHSQAEIEALAKASAASRRM